MSRTTKKGIDYFSHDVDIMQDRRIKLIKAKHGLIGYAVYLRLLEEIYRECGYYVKADDDFNLLFADDNNIDFDVYIKTLNDCIDVGLFDKNLFKSHNILTSGRIQNNYLNATERRKSISFISEFKVKDVNIKRHNVNIYSLNVNIKKQRKVKESKVKKNTVPFDDWYQHYPKKVGRKAAEQAWLKIGVDEDLLEKMLSTLSAQKKLEQWSKDKGKFIPHPSTYLNQARWEDDVQKTSTTWRDICE